jgi:catechol 2,3-dioxygenase-like lactoylglutathione lyase family enzyme
MSTIQADDSVVGLSTPDTLVRFHCSLNTSDLGRSVAFYRLLFDREPVKLRDDYAKFELDVPPLVLSLIPSAHGSSGVLNHVGIRLADATVLVETQARLEAAGFSTQREEGVACCYARQTKFWVSDPDGTLWELYILHEDIDVRGDGQVPGHLATVATAEQAEAVDRPLPKMTWSHLLTEALPERIDHADGTVDEVQLQGTFNMLPDESRLARFLAEVHRVLRPGGRVFTHGLVADRPLTSPPALPGPAALVRHVPSISVAAQAFAEAGFSGVQYLKVGKSPCFTVDGVEMRELQVSATKA